jgi:hypothetical protein
MTSSCYPKKQDGLVLASAGHHGGPHGPVRQLQHVLHPAALAPASQADMRNRLCLFDRSVLVAILVAPVLSSTHDETAW